LPPNSFSSRESARNRTQRQFVPEGYEGSAVAANAGLAGSGLRRSMKRPAARRLARLLSWSAKRSACIQPVPAKIPSLRDGLRPFGPSRKYG